MGGAERSYIPSGIVEPLNKNICFQYCWSNSAVDWGCATYCWNHYVSPSLQKEQTVEDCFCSADSHFSGNEWRYCHQHQHKQHQQHWKHQQHQQHRHQRQQHKHHSPTITSASNTSTTTTTTTTMIATMITTNITNTTTTPTS